MTWISRLSGVLGRSCKEGAALRIVVHASGEALSSIRRTVSEWLDSVSLTPERSFDLTLAVNEAASNVVAHAYENGSGTVQIDGDVVEGLVEIRIRDTGRWRADGVTEGGRGYQMMQALVDSVEVSSTVSGTEVLLRQGAS